MNSLRTYITLILTVCAALVVRAQTSFLLAGHVVDDATGQPVEYASLLVEESGQWAVSDGKGAFAIRNVVGGQLTLTVQCLGYEKRTWPMTVRSDVANLTLRIRQQNLKLSEVTVVARRKQDEATTSYTIGRQALDQQQVLSLSDVATLLPGGKTVNPTLMSDQRLSLRSSSQEKGNAADVCDIGERIHVAETMVIGFIHFFHDLDFFPGLFGFLLRRTVLHIGHGVHIHQVLGASLEACIRNHIRVILRHASDRRHALRCSPACLHPRLSPVSQAAEKAAPDFKRPPPEEIHRQVNRGPNHKQNNQKKHPVVRNKGQQAQVLRLRDGTINHLDD